MEEREEKKYFEDNKLKGSKKDIKSKKKSKQSFQNLICPL